MNVSPEQLFVVEIDPRTGYRTSDHRFGLFEEILIVGASGRAVRVDERRLAAAPRASAALRVVRRRRRHVAQIDDVELGDVHPELHGRGTKEDGESRLAKRLFSILADLTRD